MTHERTSRRARLVAAIAVLAFLVLTASAGATTLTFTGAVDNNWNTAGNWSGGSVGQVPGASDDVVINSGSAQVTGSDANARSLALDTGVAASGSLSILDHTLTVSSSGTSTIAGFLSVAGTLNLGDPTTYAGSVNSGGINVAGTLNVGSTLTLSGSGAGSPINDTTNTSLIHVLGTGSIVRNTSTGSMSIGPRVDNDGSVSVTTGTLVLAEGDAGTTTGSYAISTGAILHVDAGAGFVNFESPSITGAGSLEIMGTTLTVAAGDTFTVPALQIGGSATLTVGTGKSLSIATLVSTGGHRNGTGTLTVTGTADFSDLQLDAGTTTVAASVPSFAITKFLGIGPATTLNLNTPTTYGHSLDSNGINIGDGTLNIASTFTISGAGIDSAINDTGGSPVVHVLGGGSLIRDTNTGTVLVGPHVANDGTVSVKTGTLDLTNGGLTQAAGLTEVLASAELDGAVTLDGGTLRGTGTLGGPVTNTSGTVAPGNSPGLLTITGDYTQGALGTLAEEITGTTQNTQFDHLVVNGSLALNGTLAINSATFTPAPANAFKIISGASLRTGTFASLTGASVGGAGYTAHYDADGVTLLVNGAPPAPGNTTPPSIPSSAKPGDTVGCNPGVWTGSPGFGYQWLRDGIAIGGATTSSYVVGAGDVGHTLVCQVTATNTGGSASANSNALVPSAAPAAPPANTSPPSIPASATEGDLLVCAPGAWTGSPTFEYQWLRDGSAIAGATTETYTAAAADTGHSITCRVTATNAGGSASASSSPLTPAAKVATISGLPRAEGCVPGGLRLGIGVRSSGLKSVVVFLDGKRVSTSTKAHFTLVVPQGKIKPGRHRLRIVGNYRTGKTNKTFSFTRCRGGGRSPVIRVGGAPSRTICRTTPFTFHAVIAGAVPKSIRLTMDGAPLARPGKPNFSRSIDVPSVAPGKHEVLVLAADRFGNGSRYAIDFVRCS